MNFNVVTRITKEKLTSDKGPQYIRVRWSYKIVDLENECDKRHHVVVKKCQVLDYFQSNNGLWVLSKRRTGTVLRLIHT